MSKKEIDSVSSQAAHQKRSVTVFSPGTIANIGPGFDCLGLALDALGDRITVRESSTGSDLIRVIGRDSQWIPLEFNQNCAGIAADAARKSLLATEMNSAQSKDSAVAHGDFVPLEIEIERSLPMSGGLGASAAASVGGALATASFFGHTPTVKQLIDWALCGETAVAGRHLDNIAPCVLGGLTLSFFDGDTPVARTFSCSARYFVTLITPRLRIETKAAREILPNEVPRDVYVSGLARALGVAMGLRDGDFELLSPCIEDPFAVPLRSKLIPHFAAAREAALSTGALGFSISGSGPTMFAMSERLDVAHNIAERVSQLYFDLGVSTHVCGIGQKGARVVG